MDMPQAPAPQLIALGRALKHWRQDLGLTQREAATRCGISKRSWQDYERAKTQPSIAMIRRLAVGTGINIEDLIEPSDGKVDDDIRAIKQTMRAIESQYERTASELRELREALKKQA